MLVCFWWPAFKALNQGAAKAQFVGPIPLSTKQIILNREDDADFGGGKNISKAIEDTALWGWAELSAKMGMQAASSPVIRLIHSAVILPP